ncbi:ABC transporter ATP-binding protein [Streptomyces hyderabadensis]|uniref:ABC transporter ATP-binding protein n=1 Tax=Streptomyces hyderabadensis TaxID=598549 RepID=A0ABP9IN91_9ACTN|nr:ABC transporter ATP-binding protein [Streptomyces hyderabadensis]
MVTQAREVSDPEQSGTASAPARSRISVRNLTKTYRTRRGDVTALRNVSMDVDEGEIMVLLGPSGCGKTTLLRCVAGLEHPDAGEITVNGRTVYSSERGISLPPERRNLSMVFQSYALWPHMSVFDNVAYPLRTAKTSADEVRRRVGEVLDTVGLEKYGSSYPGQLSGGQQQRVSLARALVANQGVILFDEPLSNLDAKVRDRLREELLTLQRKIGFTALYVTHDQTEATGLGDRIAVMEVGTVAQLGSPTDIYYTPASRYVADFVGSANELTGSVAEAVGDRVRVDTSVGPLLGTPTAGMAKGEPVRVLFRPEHCLIAPDGAAAEGNRFSCTVERSTFLGSHVEYNLSASGQRLVLKTMDGNLLASGAKVAVSLDPTLARVFPAD